MPAIFIRALPPANPTRGFRREASLLASTLRRSLTFTLALALAACAVEPTGPTPAQITAQQQAALAQARAAEAREQARREEEARRLGAIPRFDAVEMRCLALTIYWEDGNAPRRGQLAVAHVVLNRLKDPRFPKTICGVVHDGGARPLHRCQFSWWCDGRSDEPRNAAQWAAAQEAARDATRPGAQDPTGGALFFHNGTVTPAWSRTRTRTAKIGGHFFYR